MRSKNHATTSIRKNIKNSGSDNSFSKSNEFAKNAKEL